MGTTAVYPPKAAQALGFLKASENDIDIYVEDNAGQNLWLNLLKNILPGDVKLTSVSLLGGRENVLAACRGDQAREGRPRLYIIDSDFDILKNIRKPNLRHLYKLRSYCVENYLMQKDGLIRIATTFDTRTTAENAERTIDFDGWFSRNERNLEKLFTCYATVHDFELGIGTTSYKVHQLFIPNSPKFDLCTSRVNARIIGLYKKLLNDVPAGSVREKMAEIRVNIENRPSRDYASGKDYILPSIYLLMRRAFGINYSVESFKAHLAQFYPSNFDVYLQRRLRKICNM